MNRFVMQILLRLILIGTILLICGISVAQESDSSKPKILRIDGRQAAILQAVFQLCDEKSESDLHLIHRKFLPVIVAKLQTYIAHRGVNPNGPPDPVVHEMQKKLLGEVAKVSGEKGLPLNAKSERWREIDREQLVGLVERLDTECKKRDFLFGESLSNPVKCNPSKSTQMEIHLVRKNFAKVTLTFPDSTRLFEFTKEGNDWLLSNFIVK